MFKYRTQKLLVRVALLAISVTFLLGTTTWRRESQRLWPGRGFSSWDGRRRQEPNRTGSSWETSSGLAPNGGVTVLNAATFLLVAGQNTGGVGPLGSGTLGPRTADSTCP